MRALAAAAVALALALPGRALAADARSSSLSWVRLPGAESCTGGRALAQAVEKRLHRPVFISTALAEVAVEGTIARSIQPDGWRAKITIADDKGRELGSRELFSEAPLCGAMDADLALVIAVMIDPDAAMSPPAAEAPAAPPPAPRVIVERVPVPVPIPPLEPAPWIAGVEAGAAFSAGLLPTVGAGVTIRGRLTPPRFFAIEIGGILWLPSTAQGDPLGAKFSLAQGFLDACPLATSAGGARFLACAGMELGTVRAGGFGFNLSEEQEQVVVDASLGGRASRRIVGPLTGSVAVDVLVPFVRDRFFYEDRSGAELEVFRMSPVAGKLAVSLGVEFP
jgi:hypothetical protein